MPVIEPGPGELIVTGQSRGTAALPSHDNQSEHLQNAANAVKQGGVIAYPTEAVWGLGCDPRNEQAVRKVFEIKQRDLHKGLILVSGNAVHFAALFDGLNAGQKASVLQPQDHPTTWLVPDPDDTIPQLVKGAFSSVAVRLTDHPLVSALCDLLGHPIVSTSANPAGLEPATTEDKIRQYFGESLAYILPGALGGYTRPSIIKDLQSGELHRE